MMRLRISLVLLVVLGCERQSDQSTQFESALTIGVKRQIESKVLGETRELHIQLPESYSTSSFRYPVLYVLDGEYEFGHAANIVQFLSGTGQIPEMIVVGVLNTDRARDLTPESPDDLESPKFWGVVGGANRFRDFFREELMPFMDSEYRTDPYRIVRGQSFGGLFALHDYMNEPAIFDAVIASSAGVGWNADELVKEALDYFKNGVPRPLYMSAAEYDFSGNLAANSDFAGIINSHNPDADKWRFEYFTKEEHYSLSFLSTYHGLKFLYADWQVPNDLATDVQFEDFEAHYAMLSEKYGYQIKIPMLTIMRLGRALLREQKFEDGINIYIKNTELYSNQPEVFWYLGNAYELQERWVEARDNFETAFKLAESMSLPDLADYEASLQNAQAQSN